MRSSPLSVVVRLSSQSINDPCVGTMTGGLLKDKSWLTDPVDQIL